MGLLARACVAGGLAAAWLAVPAAAQPPVPAPPRVLDGPSASILSLGGLDVARDGTGGLVYLEAVSGIPRVFVSRLIGGVFQAPQQIDAALPGASSQPVITAANGGELVVAFVNGGTLYQDTAVNGLAGLSGPVAVMSGARNPAIASTTLGKVYLAFTAADGAGSDIRCAYYDNGQWGLETTPMNVVAADDAGTGSGRPAVAAANDGVGIVGWGEGGHVYVRRIWGTGPSVAFYQADPPALSGWSEVSADEPALATGSDSSYVNIAFHEVVASAGVQQSRVLEQRLQASQWDGVIQADALTTPGPEGADRPQIEEGEYGEGFLTSERTITHQLVATRLNGYGGFGGEQRLDSLPNSGSPYAAVGSAGNHSSVVAWQQDPGEPATSPGPAEIRLRYYDGSQWYPEQVLSTPAGGATQAAQGLAVAGDIATDVAAAWVQGTGANTEIVAAQMYQPPGSFGANQGFAYVRTTAPTLAWSAAREPWGPLVYAVSLDGVPVGQTTTTALALPTAQAPSPLGQGPHVWTVTATNPAGLTSTMRSATVFVDTLPPVVNARITGKRRVGSPIHVVVRATDAPPPLPSVDASGVATIEVKFGDRAKYLIHRGKAHVYAKARTYSVTVTVTDNAGNVTRTVQRVKIRRRRRRHA